ncbi:hypothetical protein ABPG72_000112 [Tetrahymena utriculariae]
MTDNKDDSAVQKQFSKYMEFYNLHKQATAQEITLGTVFGYCSGAFTRRMARIGVFVSGGLFVTAQLLSFQGYVNIEWNKMEQDAVKALDQNGDNKIDMQDFKIIYDKYLSTLQYRLPSSTGFAAGFLLGWRGKLI